MQLVMGLSDYEAGTRSRKVISVVLFTTSAIGAFDALKVTLILSTPSSPGLRLNDEEPIRGSSAASDEEARQDREHARAALPPAAAAERRGPTPLTPEAAGPHAVTPQMVRHFAAIGRA